MKDKWLVLDGKKIHYLEAGKGSPVVLVHALFGSTDGLMKVTRELAEKFKVYVPDLPGFGCKYISDELDCEHTIAAYADFMQAFVEQLKLGKVDVMGHSMGGTIALEWVVRYPEQIKKLAVFEPVLGSEEVSLTAQLVGRLAYKVKAVRKLARWLVAKGQQREEFAKRLLPEDKMEMRQEVYGASLRAAAESARDLMRGVDIERYRRIQIPVLVVSGGVGSRISTPKVAEKLMHVLLHAQAKRILGGAHIIVREDDQAPVFAKVLSDFFSS